MTRTPDEAGAAAAARAFFPSEAPLAVERFGAGHINDTYRVEPDPSDRAYLLQRINHEVFTRPERVMDNIRRVYAHLARHDDLACLLRPVARPDGAILHRDSDGNAWRVFPFFENTVSPERAEHPEQAVEAAAAIGRFLARLTDLDPGGLHHTIPDFHNSPARYRSFARVAARDPVGRRRSVEDEVREIERQHHLFDGVFALPLPERVVHNDAKISNVLFDAGTGRACGLVDWDTIMPGTLLSDFGDLVRSSVSTVSEDHPDPDEVRIRLPIFRALCQGFVPEVEGRASPVELDNLVLGAQWITLEQAMRFLADHLAGDPYYKVAYPNHNRDRARNQLALFRALRHRHAELDQILRSFRSSG